MAKADDTPSTSTPDPVQAWRVSFWHARRADARAFLRETPTSRLLADLADLRADLAQPIPPVWWMDAVIQAGRIRAVLRERGIPTVNLLDVRHGESAR